MNQRKLRKVTRSLLSKYSRNKQEYTLHPEHGRVDLGLRGNPALGSDAEGSDLPASTTTAFALLKFAYIYKCIYFPFCTPALTFLYTGSDLPLYRLLVSQTRLLLSSSPINEVIIQLPTIFPLTKEHPVPIGKTQLVLLVKLIRQLTMRKFNFTRSERKGRGREAQVI